MDSDLDVMLNTSLEIARKVDSNNFKLKIFEIDIKETNLRHLFSSCVTYKIDDVELDIEKILSRILLNTILKVMSTINFVDSGSLVEENHSFNSIIYEVDLTISNMCLNTSVDIDYDRLFKIKDLIAKLIINRICELIGNNNIIIKPINDFMYEDLIESNVRDNIFYILSKDFFSIKLISFSQRRDNDI